MRTCKLGSHRMRQVGVPWTVVLRENPKLLRFGPFEVNLALHEVRKHGTRIHLNGKAYSLLLRLLSEPGTPVSREDLQRLLWPDGTFVDFDHSLNSIVSRLRSQLHDSAGAQHYIETVGGFGYKFVETVQAVPAEDTPEPIPPPKISWWQRGATKLAAAAVMVAASIVAVWGIHWRSPENSHSIAMLPLQNLAKNPEQDFLADGMTDAITTELGRSQGLQVISGTSAARYKNSAKSLQTIARELNVNYLVEGAVRSFENRVHINVRLVVARTDRHLWSKSYDIELNEARRTESEIAAAVAAEISAKVDSNRRPLTPVSSEAYENYLKGRFMLAKGTEEGVRKSVDYFCETIAKAPGYAEAHAALAESYNALSTNYSAPGETMPKARQEADAALRLDDSSSEAHAIRGQIATSYDWDWRLAQQHLQRAIQLNSNSAVAHVAYADFLVGRGKFKQALTEIEQARALDPISLANSAELQLALFDSERFDLLPVYAAKSLELDPEFPWAHTLLGWTHARSGKAEEGLAQAERGFRSGNTFEQGALLGEIQVMAGRRTAAEDRLNQLLEQRKSSYVCAHAIGGLYAALGLKDQALQWLETAYRERSGCMPFLAKDPATECLRTDPRFQRLVARINSQ